MGPRTPLGRRLEQRVRADRNRTLRRNLVLGLASVLVLVAAGVVFFSVRETGPTAGSKAASAPASESRPDTGNPAGQAPERFTVSTSGDILIHSPVWTDALAYSADGGYDFTPMFEPIRRYIKGVDLAICHVETPITTGPPSGYPIFSAPADLADSIRRAGWKACDTASNHSLDQGQDGIDQTGELLDRQRIRHTGSARSAAAARHPVILRAGPARVGLVAYTDATNGIPPPHRYSVNLLPAADPAGLRAARIARDVGHTLDAGADTVIVSLQWGDENSATPNPSQRALAKRVVAIEGVAAIAGQGPHVVQPIERIGGKFVVFSAGNLLSNQGAYSGLPAETQDGLIALFRFAGRDGEYRVKRVDYVPVMVNPAGHAVLPAGSGSKAVPELAGALADSWQRTVDVAGRRARVRPIPPHRP